MSTQPNGEQMQVIAAVADLIGRTGAADFNVEWHELENRAPGGRLRIVWWAYAGWPDGRWEVGSATEPATAATRLIEAVVDGGTCTHCHRMTTADTNWRNPISSAEDAPWCAYIYDPSTHKFVRSCA